MKKTLKLAMCALLVLLAACGGTESHVPSPPWKETDKHLNCQQLLLEMNDAKFWNVIAQDNMSAGVTDILWPPGYISTRASAKEAAGATGARIRHLQNIYQIKGCERPYADTPVPDPY